MTMPLPFTDALKRGKSLIKPRRNSILLYDEENLPSSGCALGMALMGYSSLRFEAAALVRLFPHLVTAFPRSPCECDGRTAHLPTEHFQELRPPVDAVHTVRWLNIITHLFDRHLEMEGLPTLANCYPCERVSPEPWSWARFIALLTAQEEAILTDDVFMSRLGEYAASHPEGLAGLLQTMSPISPSPISSMSTLKLTIMIGPDLEPQPPHPIEEPLPPELTEEEEEEPEPVGV